MPEYQKVKVTNVSNGPRGVHTKTGVLTIEKGDTFEQLEMTEGEINSSKSTGWFEISGFTGKPDAEEPAKTPAEVLAMASNPDVPFMTFKAAAAKLLGDKTPAKKDEIVAALEELATTP